MDPHGSINKDNPENYILAQVFDVTYYREKDMREFRHRYVWLIYLGKAYTRSTAQDNEVLREQLVDLDRYIDKLKRDSFKLIPPKIGPVRGE